ncbi:hypothetical protein PLICRDRAFT_247970 [Plicaturopsis crispa FD-325 SS-3]|nr:hypothetical protein PLICRDRAFT_247970 [Plicaturopsis crispa FD-325 SS-3]
MSYPPRDSGSFDSRAKKIDSQVRVEVAPAVMSQATAPQVYTVDPWRFAALGGVVLIHMTLSMNTLWFAPMSSEIVAEFGFTLDQVNWLGNVFHVVYLPLALVVPYLRNRFGIRRCYEFGAACMLLGAWVRYAGTVKSLSKESSYALFLVAQMLTAVTQPIVQVLGPKFSQTWFDLKGRGTATMAIAISGPIGSAVGQAISPRVGAPRFSILILGIISSVGSLAVLLIKSEPPTPPTFAASQGAPPLIGLCRTVLGLDSKKRKYSPVGSSQDVSVFEAEKPTDMTARERVDLVLLVWIFGVLVATVNSFGLITGQVFHPYNFPASQAGTFGATLLVSGMVASILASIVFDRVLTHHIAVTIKTLVPIIAAAWVALIFAVRPNAAPAIYVIMAVIGMCGVTLLPIALELAVELTRNPEGSSAMMWFSANIFGLIFTIVDGYLRAPATANPPLNMHNALIFTAAFGCAAAAPCFFIQGRQARRERDEAQAAAVRDMEMRGS